MSLADGMKNYETRTSFGFCGDCKKQTTALWERINSKLVISCESCGKIILVDNDRFKTKSDTAK